MKLPLAEISDLRPGVFGLSFVYLNALYRLRLTPGEAVEWAERIERPGRT